MVGVVERQRDMIQRLEERDRARTQAEAKFAQPQVMVRPLGPPKPHQVQ